MSISLSKGQKISLSKKSGDSLNKVAVGLGWAQRTEIKEKKVGGFLGFGGKLEKFEHKVEVDFDASCVLYDANKNQPVDVVYFGKLKSTDGSILHTGDDRGGGGAETDPNEVINVNLNNVPDNVVSIVFVVNSYSGESFNGIPWAFCNVEDASNGKEIARYNLNVEGGTAKGFVAAKVYREGGEWKFHAIGEAVTGVQKTVRDIEPFARKHA